MPLPIHIFGSFRPISLPSRPLTLLRRIAARLTFLLLGGGASFALAQSPTPFELRDGDRVVFLGDTLIERAQRDGYLEQVLTARFPERNITFRNLGWSADTPQGMSRVSFDWNKPADEWVRQLSKQISDAKPSVLLVGYGMASSFDGTAGLERFRQQMNRLLDEVARINPEARIVLLGPIRHENLGAPWPNPRLHNEQLRVYSDALRDLAVQRRCWFVSLFDALGDGTSSPERRAYTDNGIHLTSYGYRRAAAVIERGLGWEPLVLDQGPKFAAAELLRAAINKKNQLFFNRWRPENSTYLFLFRKHEQGQNAREIPLFDPLVEAEERRIAVLRKLDPAKTPEPLTLKEAPEPAALPQSVLHFQTDPQIEITLWAENPLLAKPIQINFDPQGRLWVVSSSVYPQIEPGQEADDKVLILEDRDGDGRAEKSTVFADGLLIPTGIEPGDGGAYVGQSTELLHFKDSDGDGKADQRRVVLSGFGTEDTHHILHTLRWGFDGQLYMNQSIYIHTHTETPQGVVRLNSGGILNLRPANGELGIFMKGLVNTWGHHFDSFGSSFVTDGAGTPEAGLSGISYVVPGAMYHTYDGARRILGSISPGSYPKFCSLELLQSEQFPADWQGNLFTCDFRANRIVRFSVAEDGSAFVTKEMPLFVRTTNVTFRPIDIKVGPDGALYVADWSNPIIQHGEVDFRDPRRDHSHGRIWRIAAKGRPPLKAPSFLAASDTELFEQLLSPNSFNQAQARRVLAERGKVIVDDLRKWLTTQKAEKSRLAALWMFQAVDVTEPDLLRELLQAKDGRIRAAAARVAGAWAARLPDASDLLAARISDEHPRVRMEAARALSRIPTARSAELVLSAVDRPMDRHLEYALWLSINDLAVPWVEAIKAGRWSYEGRDKQLEFGLDAIEPDLAGEVVGGLAAGKTFAPDGSGPWLGLIGKAGGPKELSAIFEAILAAKFDERGSPKALQALAQAAKLRKTRPNGNLDRVLPLLQKGNEPTRVAAIQLAAEWKLQPAIKPIVAIAEETAAAATRSAAFEGLRVIGGSEVATALQPLAGREQKPELRRQAALVLASLNLKEAAPLLVAALNDATEEKEALALWRSSLAIKGGAKAITAALPKTGLAPTMAKTGLRVAREAGRNEAELILALSRGADLDEVGQTLTDAEMKQLAAASAQGDPARGQQIYRRAQLACLTCHAIGGVGGKVGPDMTSIGASAPVDYLIESILYPNRKVKEGYHSVVVETKDGQELSGILVRENNEQIFIRDVQSQEIAVAKNNIASRTPGNSLMPSGLIDFLSSGERLDLFRFLSELGKPGPYDATKGNVARFWRLLPATIDLLQFGDGQVLKMDLNSKGWIPTFATVEGRVLKSDLEAALQAIQWRGPTALYAAAQFQLSKAGRVSWQTDLPAGTAFWVDGKSLLQPQDGLDLAAGVHTVVAKLDAKKLPDHIRVAASEGTFLGN